MVKKGINSKLEIERIDGRELHFSRQEILPYHIIMLRYSPFAELFKKHEDYFPAVLNPNNHIGLIPRNLYKTTKRGLNLILDTKEFEPMKGIIKVRINPVNSRNIYFRIFCTLQAMK